VTVSTVSKNPFRINDDTVDTVIRSSDEHPSIQNKRIYPLPHHPPLYLYFLKYIDIVSDGLGRLESGRFFDDTVLIRCRFNRFTLTTEQTSMFTVIPAQQYQFAVAAYAYEGEIKTQRVSIVGWRIPTEDGDARPIFVDGSVAYNDAIIIPDDRGGYTVLDQAHYSTLDEALASLTPRLLHGAA
jgi:hypothetical protein